MSKYKVGDRVKIVEGKNVSVNAIFSRYIGIIGIIAEIRTDSKGIYGYKVKLVGVGGGTFWWREDELEFVEDSCNNLNKLKEVSIDGIGFVLVPKDEYYSNTIGKENRDKFNPYERNIDNKYYYVNARGYIIEYYDDKNKFDEDNYDFGNYFNDKEFAEKKAREWKLRNLLERFSYENGGDKIDWENESQRKWYIFTNKIEKSFVYTDYVFSNRDVGSIYFISEEAAKEAGDKYRDLINEVYKL